MIIPPKHQDLNKSIINIGANVLKNIKRKEKFVDDVYHDILKKNPLLSDLLIDEFFLSVIFLLTLNLIQLKGGIISINNDNS